MSVPAAVSAHACPAANRTLLASRHAPTFEDNTPLLKACFMASSSESWIGDEKNGLPCGSGLGPQRLPKAAHPRLPLKQRAPQQAAPVRPDPPVYSTRTR